MATKPPVRTTHEGRTRLRIDADAGGGTSEWLMVREYEVTVVVKPATGTMRAEYTWSSPDTVLNDPNSAIAVPWTPGDSGAIKADIVRRPTAIRFVATAAGSGEIAA